MDERSRRSSLGTTIRHLVVIGRRAREAFHSGLTHDAASRVAQMLRDALRADAVALIGRAKVLAFVGAGADHHVPDQPVATELTKRVLRTGEAAVARSREEIGCPHPGCPLTGAVVVPMRVRGMIPAAIKFYRTDGRPFAPQTLEGAVLVGDLLGAQLEIAFLESEVDRLARTELRALRAEISPHFVFNTLHSVAAVVGRDPQRARRLITDFAEFLRHALRSHGEFCTLEEELWYVEQYLAFERTRLGDRLRTSVEVPASVLGRLVPVLTLQPLVENAVVHGIEPKTGRGTVWVRAEESEDHLRLIVEDDGVGIPPRRLEVITERGIGSGLGIGLFNVQRRLQAIYGEDYGLRVRSEEGRGTRVVVRIPYRWEATT
ncbi:MAG: histidine kinase [Armatimonadota bacterium]|nr:histidine kinase [Armatimonadota bacterium]